MTRSLWPLTLCLLFLASGCLRAKFERNNQLHPIAEEDLAGLVPGETSLDECLRVLGAPLWVREERTYGAELAYGWFKHWDWGLTVSVPVAENFSASFNYDEIDEKLRGAVLLFDKEWNLAVVRTGYLRELAARRLQPAFLEPDAFELEGDV